MRKVFALCLVSACFVAACSVGPDGSPPPTGTSESSIIGGQADTTHDAVVALISQKGQEAGACTGTIVKKDGRVAYVLTAAHCVVVPPVVMFRGNNYDSPQVLSYPILDYAAHPQYGGQVDSPYDVAVVRVLGATASTPVIPITASPDQVTNGMSLLSLGYGLTRSPGDPRGENTVRKSISHRVSGSSSSVIQFNYEQGGVCRGDSGGPSLRGTGAQERVVGVHSFGSADCLGPSTDARVTFPSNFSFINQQLAKPPPAESCSTCMDAESAGDAPCAVKQSACAQDTACAALAKCRNECSTPSCQSGCDDKFPRGIAKYYQAAYCTCGDGVCLSLCKAECRSVPRCGHVTPNDACGNCIDPKCCDSLAACAADTDCKICLRDGANADASCATNKLRKAVADCAATRCKEECASDPVGQGGEPPPDENGGAPPENNGKGPVTTTTTTTGCHVASPGGAPGSGGSGGAALALGAAFLVGVGARRRGRRGPG